MTRWTLALAVLFGISRVQGEVMQVASLSTVLSDIAANVGGEKIQLVNIVRPGVDPHRYEPTPSDIRRISESRLVLANGLGFESYLNKLRHSVGAGPEFVVAGDAIEPMMGFDDCEAGGVGHRHGSPENTPDPHWFHSIRNVEIVTNQIRDAFARADPANKASYFANAAAYQEKLADLARWVKLQLAKLPKNRRILITSHDALGYFARENGFTILAVEGISTSDQPSSKKVVELIEKIRGAQVKAIFAETIENPKTLVEITRETGAKLGGSLYADGLGDKEANTFEGMMRHNVSTIVEALR